MPEQIRHLVSTMNILLSSVIAGEIGQEQIIMLRNMRSKDANT